MYESLRALPRSAVSLNLNHGLCVALHCDHEGSSPSAKMLRQLGEVAREGEGVGHLPGEKGGRRGARFAEEECWSGLIVRGPSSQMLGSLL